jgi:hypothetical protein
MGRRHRIVEVEPMRIAGDGPMAEQDRGAVVDRAELAGDRLSSDEPQLIDETVADRARTWTLNRFGPDHPAPAAVFVGPGSRQPGVTQPSVRQSGVRPGQLLRPGIDAWPRRDSRLVRLFACDPTVFVSGVAGRRWDRLDLGIDVRLLESEHRVLAEWPKAVAGELRMPYLSRPLAVDLVCQPFNARFIRVDVVLRSRGRRPRRYFDVAYGCLSEMRRFESNESARPASPR